MGLLILKSFLSDLERVVVGLDKEYKNLIDEGMDEECVKKDISGIMEKHSNLIFFMCSGKKPDSITDKAREANVLLDDVRRQKKIRNLHSGLKRRHERPIRVASN